MHNCRFALICRIVPHPSHLPISFNCGVGVECGIFCARCSTSHYCIYWMSWSPALRPCYYQTLLSLLRLTAAYQYRTHFIFRMKISDSACRFSFLLPHSYTSPSIWGTSDGLGFLCVPMLCAHLEGAAMLPALGCVFILHLLSKVCTK